MWFWIINERGQCSTQSRPPSHLEEPVLTCATIREPFPTSEERFLYTRPDLDWSRIALGVSLRFHSATRQVTILSILQVSSEISLSRSARSCQIRWLSELDPGVNREPWSEWEKANLRHFVDQFRGQAVDWNYVAHSLQVPAMSTVISS